MKKKTNLKFNLKKKIYYIYGDNLYKKYKYKMWIKKNIKLKFNNTITTNIVINKNIEWKYIYEKIFFKNFFFKTKIIILNFTEKIKKLIKLIKNNILNKIIFKNYKYMYIIFIIEFTKFLSLLEINILKNKYVKFIECNNKICYKENIFNKTINKKYQNIKIIKSLINSLKKKNIYKTIIILKKIQNINFNKLLILNILFNFITQNINQFKYKKIIKILKIIKKCEINIKKGINISWIHFDIIILYILK